MSSSSSSALSVDEQIAAVNAQIIKVEAQIDVFTQAVEEAEVVGNDDARSID
jgi:hypothetical protein